MLRLTAPEISILATPNQALIPWRRSSPSSAWDITGTRLQKAAWAAASAPASRPSQLTAVAMSISPIPGITVSSKSLYFSGVTYNQPVGWQIVVAGTGLSGPAGVAVDSSGDVYIADTGNDRVLRETPSGGGFFTQSVVVTGLSGPTGLAVDDIGNLYISDTGNHRVLKETVSGSSYTQSIVLNSGLGSPQGLALDALGNIYIADATNKVVVKLTLATAPSLTFASTAEGSPAATVHRR